jgi:hypothetical protein
MWGLRMFCNECGTDLPDDSHFCRKCGYALAAMSSPDTSPALGTTTTKPPTVSSPAPNSPNLGTIVFAGFALLSLAVSLAKGLLPIYLAEAALWACLAWYWQRRASTSATARLIFLLCAVFVAAGEGYLIGRGSMVTVEQPTALGAHNPYAPYGGSVDAPATPTTPSNLIDKVLAETPNPRATIAPDQAKKAKPVPPPVLGYATVATYEEDIYQRCAFNTGSTPCFTVDGPENDFSGRLATLKKDDRVEILSARVRAPNGKEVYKVRFRQWTGWIDAEGLTLKAQ